MLPDSKEIKTYSQFQRALDGIIKSVWINEISADYKNCDLLKEDTVKCAMYRHIKNRLDALQCDLPVKMFTEFNGMGLKDIACRADMVVVRIDKRRKNCHLTQSVKEVLAVIEIKFQDYSGYQSLYTDVYKTKKYIKFMRLKGFERCQYYIANIHEAMWSFKDSRLLQRIQYSQWAKGCVTELNARYFEERNGRDMGFYIHSYNRCNMELECNHLEKVKFVTMH